MVQLNIKQTTADGQRTISNWNWHSIGKVMCKCILFIIPPSSSVKPPNANTVPRFSINCKVFITLCYHDMWLRIDVHAFFEDCLLTNSLPNTPRSQLIISATNQSFEGAGLSFFVELSKTEHWWGYDILCPSNRCCHFFHVSVKFSFGDRLLTLVCSCR